MGEQRDYVRAEGRLPPSNYTDIRRRHGRDHKLRAWQVTESSLEGETLDARLPAEEGLDGTERRQPWLLHSMDVSALNFCAFAMCIATISAGEAGSSEFQAIIAVPNALDSGGIDFFHLPSERRVSVLKADPQTKTGMVMALDLFDQPETGLLIVVSGYEDGRTMVHRRKPLASPNGNWNWEMILVSRPHSQPVLSLDTAPSKDFYFTSSADAVIAKFAVPTNTFGGDMDIKTAKTNNTKHAGQQDLNVRKDGKIFATAGWDARIRVYSTKTLRELAVLKWHQDGCYCVAFADTFSHEKSFEPGQDQALVASSDSNNSALEIIRQQRSIKAQMTHWLAAGGKDGKISLWDIY